MWPIESPTDRRRDGKSNNRASVEKAANLAENCLTTGLCVTDLSNLERNEEIPLVKAI
jgi:hypothetical protein